MYDTFSTDYDRFVNWNSRLAYELPFLEAQLQVLAPVNGDPIRVLDAACGTGMHALALERRGYAAAGADLSAGMIAQAQQNAAQAGVDVPFEVAAFGKLAQTFSGSPRFPFDAVLCLGNSLPHLLTPESLASTLADFAACLRPGGLLLLQNRNFDAVLRDPQRWMDPQSHRDEEREWLFLRFYDYRPDGLIDFNILTLYREGEGGWSQRVTTTPLHPLLQAGLSAALSTARFENTRAYGDLAGTAFDPANSGNLVIVTQRSP